MSTVGGEVLHLDRSPHMRAFGLAVCSKIYALVVDNASNASPCVKVFKHKCVTKFMTIMYRK